MKTVAAVIHAVFRRRGRAQRDDAALAVDRLVGVGERGDLDRRVTDEEVVPGAHQLVARRRPVR